MMAERETRQWWAFNELTGRVEFVTGYRCMPENPDYWWVPELGYSLSEQHHLFTDEGPALTDAYARLQKEQAALDKKFANNMAQLSDCMERQRHTPT